MEKFDEIVRQNLHGSSYLQTWNDLPHYIKCILAESAKQLHSSTSTTPVEIDKV